MDKLKELKAKHDKLLADKAEEDVHETTDCLFCNPDLTKKNESEERGDMDTFTKEQAQALADDAVAKAVAPILSELDTLKAAQGESEIEAKIQAAKEEAAEAIKDLQAKLDEAVLKATNAETELADVKTFLDEAAAEQAEVELAESRKDARTELIKEKTSFTDEYINERIADWATLTDEDFDARLGEWTALSPVKEDGGAKVKLDTAMKTIRKDAGASTTARSRLGELLRAEK
jgi:hypothetical protein